LKIDISYDGAYPNLCRGHLKVTVRGKVSTVWDFGEHALSSEGSVSFDDDWQEHVERGPWHIRQWPDGFPVELKDAVTEAVNDQVDHGCCGGCV
jgi:hypothetical protein